MTKVEEVARAICNDDAKTRGYSQQYADVIWPKYVSAARAAIKAMREPTDGMTYVGQSMRHETVNSMGAIHRAMIDAALKEQP